MEYLPLPDNGLPHIQVPYLPGFEYDGLEFESFPARSGRDDLGRSFHLETRIQDGKVAIVEDRSRITFVQAWLYFGLIQSFLGDEIRSTGFLKQSNVEPGAPIVNSSIIGHVLQDLLLYYQNLNVDAGDLHTAWDRFRAAENDLSAAVRAYNRLCVQMTASDPCPQVLLSIGVLISVLIDFEQIVLRNVKPLRLYRLKDSQSNPVRHSYRHGYGNIDTTFTSLLEKRMRRGNWCPMQRANILSEQELLITYYMSSVV